jgi:hypothetical protein
VARSAERAAASSEPIDAAQQLREALVRCIADIEDAPGSYVNLRAED